MMEARTWKCPDCGETAEISYDWLAEHGGPVCGKCDCDMELQPESQNDAFNSAKGQIVQHLNEKATAIFRKLTDGLRKVGDHQQWNNNSSFMAACVEIIGRTGLGPLVSASPTTTSRKAI